MSPFDETDGEVELLRTRFDYEWFDNPVPNLEILADIEGAVALRFVLCCSPIRSYSIASAVLTQCVGRQGLCGVI
jgi:hypothetical protein